MKILTQNGDLAATFDEQLFDFILLLLGIRQLLLAHGIHRLRPIGCIRRRDHSLVLLRRCRRLVIAALLADGLVGGGLLLLECHLLALVLLAE